MVIDELRLRPPPDPSARKSWDIADAAVATRQFDRRQLAKTLSFFSASRACSIDFGQFAPMFRLDAARYRNAIS
jgi:hypothetical protein